MQSNRRRKRTRTIVTICCALAVVLTGIYGYNMSRSKQRAQTTPTPNPTALATPSLQTPTVPAVNPTEPLIELQTAIEQTTKYIDCKHERKTTLATTELIGLTRAQLAAMYPQWTIGDFTTFSVTMSREVAGVCPLHFMLKKDPDKADTLIIYQRDDNGEWQTVQVISELDLSYMETKLIEGIIFDKMEQIEGYLENYE